MIMQTSDLIISGVGVLAGLVIIVYAVLIKLEDKKKLDEYKKNVEDAKVDFYQAIKEHLEKRKS